MAGVTDRIHDHELDTSEPIVRSLLGAHWPTWDGATLTSLASSGTTNALWRAQSSDGMAVVARLPRTPGAVSSVELECRLLPVLASTWSSTTIDVPSLVHVGQPTDEFPHPWALFDWLDGDDLWNTRTERASMGSQLAVDVAASVREIRALDDLPIAGRSFGDRGGPFDGLLAAIDRWLEDPQWAAADRIDVDRIRFLVAEGAEVVGEPFEVGVVHGDLIPGNLLMNEGRLSAVIDWGCVAMADLAQDVGPAWALFDGEQRSIFRSELEVDDAMWLRARTTELEHAIGAVLYYEPKGHTLGEVNRRTLERILQD